MPKKSIGKSLMPQTKILVDTNSYLRLAISIHPLLFIEFGKKKYCLYTIPELDKEFNNSRILKDKFHWVNDEQYIKNRRKRLSASKCQHDSILITPSFLQDTAIKNNIDVSYIDLLVLSYGLTLGITVVTDDLAMIKLARIYQIKILTTLQLIKLMLDCKHINIDKVREIAQYLDYTNDKPSAFNTIYKKLFKETPPDYE